MPWLKSSVPKFGNWDKSEDLSYSIIFDKARQEKEKFLHIPERDSSPSDQSFDKNSNAGAGKKTPHSAFTDKARADRERFLSTSQQDKSFAHLQQNALQNPDVTARRGASSVSYDKNWGVRPRISGYGEPKSTPGARILREQQNSSNVQQDSSNHSEAPAYNSSFPTGAKSRATRETTFFNERQHVHQEDVGYQGRLHVKSTNAPGRCMYEENPAVAKLRSSQQGLEISRTAEMQRKHVVPKFGDWNSGEGFTEAFNKVRIEKNTKYAVNPSVIAVSPLRRDEDLYKSSGTSGGSSERKKRRGWFPMICCSAGPFPHSTDL